MYFHSKLCDGIAYPSGKSLTPTHVQNNPLVFLGHSVRSVSDAMVRKQPPNNPDVVVVAPNRRSTSLFGMCG